MRDRLLYFANMLAVCQSLYNKLDIVRLVEGAFLRTIRIMQRSVHMPYNSGHYYAVLQVYHCFISIAIDKTKYIS